MKFNEQTGTKIVISLVCLVVIAVNKWQPELFKLDPLSAALLVVAILPWFSGIIKAVKLPFIEIELQEAKETAERALETAQDAKSTAAGAETRARVAEKISSVEVVVGGVQASAIAGPSPSSDPQQLVDRYNHVRKTHKSGDYRTELMEQIAAEMIAAAKGFDAFDLTARLRDSDKGWRLFAYAYLIARPDFSWFDELAKTAYENTGSDENKNQPFGEYWSIRAMQALAAKREEKEVSSAGKQVLLDWYRNIRRGTDRHFEMQRLLQMLDVNFPR